MKKKTYIAMIFFVLMMLLSACGLNSGNISDKKDKDSEELVYEYSMKLKYATQFSVDYYRDGYKLITIANGDKFIIVPEGKEVPDTDAKMTVIHQKPENIYMVSSSQMDLVRAINGLADIKMTGTKESDWYIDEIRDLMQKGDILYAGKYSAPDYELILSADCDMAVENTMIYHTPEVKEKLEELGIPVIVEYSSMEPHPLGRLEWVKLYGALLDQESEAEEFFENETGSLDGIINQEATDKTVAYFYINSRGAVNVRKSGDYIAKMIELAGGRYLFEHLTDENALSTMNIQMEEFIESAMEADFLVYNSTIDGKIQSVEELLLKCPELADSKAVKEGNVWCTEKNMFQETTGISQMILEFHCMMTGEKCDYKYMYQLK